MELNLLSLWILNLGQIFCRAISCTEDRPKPDCAHSDNLLNFVFGGIEEVAANSPLVASLDEA
jgi:hypothetical protein